MSEQAETILDDPESVWAALTSGERESRIVDFPRKGKKGETVTCALWVLTHGEQMSAIAAAEEATRESLKTAGTTSKKDDAGQGYQDLYTNAACREVLYRACRNAVKPHLPFFPGRKFVSELTTDEVGVLYNSYLQTQAYLSPIVTDPGSREELEARVAAMQRAGNFGGLAFFSLGALMMLTQHLALRLFGSDPDNSSSGSPPGDSSEATPAPAS